MLVPLHFRHKKEVTIREHVQKIDEKVSWKLHKILNAQNKWSQHKLMWSLLKKKKKIKYVYFYTQLTQLKLDLTNAYFSDNSLLCIFHYVLVWVRFTLCPVRPRLLESDGFLLVMVFIPPTVTMRMSYFFLSWALVACVEPLGFHGEWHSISHEIIDMW